MTPIEQAPVPTPIQNQTLATPAPAAPRPIDDPIGVTRARRPGYLFCQFICQVVMLSMFGYRAFGVRHVPAQGGVLLACNHQSFLDPVIATCALHREGSYMARDTLFGSGPFTGLIRYLNAYPVKRGMADLGAVKETLRRLRNGELITVFPEATRTPDGSILPMQPGAVAIARKAGVPIVPCLIDGAFEAWPRQQKLPSPSRIRVYYAPALLPSDLRNLTDDDAINKIRDALIAMQQNASRAR